jgi:putative ABC transport system permease protein
VTLPGIVVRSVLRNKFRGLMTVLGVAVAVLAWILLRTVLHAWGVGAEYAAKDRLSTRNKVSFGIPLPKRYVGDILAGVPGVQSVTYCEWFGGRWSRDPDEFFANMACADNAFEVYPEISIDPEALAKWKGDRKGAIVGDVLARKLGWHVGDSVTLQGSFFPGAWEFTIDGIYTAPAESAVDRSTFFFRWDYKNDGVEERQKNLVGWIFTRVDDASKGPAVSRAIDALFDDRDVQTATTSEREANSSLMGGVSALLRALDLLSGVVLAILTLILGNTIAMGVRERTTEFGVLRALGFQPGHIRGLIVAEALVVSLTAGGIGVALAFPLVQVGLGGWLEENMGQFFPAFRITGGTIASVLAVVLGLGALSALVPALRAGRMPVTEALRRVA